MDKQIFADYVSGVFLGMVSRDIPTLFTGIESVEETKCKDCFEYNLRYRIGSRVDKTRISVLVIKQPDPDMDSDPSYLQHLFSCVVLKVEARENEWRQISPFEASIKWFWIATLSLV